MYLIPVEVGPRTVVIRFGIPANSFRMGCGGAGAGGERERERSFIDNQECLKVGKHNALSGDTASHTHTFTHTLRNRHLYTRIHRHSKTNARSNVELP